MKLIRSTAVRLQPAPSSQHVTVTNRLSIEIVTSPISIKKTFNLVQGTVSWHELRQDCGDIDMAHRHDQLPPTLAARNVRIWCQVVLRESIVSFADRSLCVSILPCA